MLDALQGANPGELLDNWTDGRIKLFLMHRLLTFRREKGELFQRGSYEPLSLKGEFADCCVVFARETERQTIVVLAPRLSSRVGFPPLGQAWRDTAVQMPNGFSEGRDLFTGKTFAAADGKLQLAGAFASLPFAALIAL